MGNLADPKILIYQLIAIVLGVTVHECAHAVAGVALGDDTPSRQGRVTLNPLAHLDPIGTIFILVTIFAGFGIGWGRPVLVDPRNLRPNATMGMALVAIAGPISNILLAMIFVIGLPAAADWSDDLFTFVRYCMILNVYMAVFNMIPLPPLDGSKVVLGLLPPQQVYRLEPFLQYGPLVLLGLVMLVPGFLGSIIGPAASVIIRLLVQFGAAVNRVMPF